MKKLTSACDSALEVAAALMVLGLGSAGCSTVSDQQAETYVSLGKEYYNAPNVAQCIVVDNTNTNQVAEFTVRKFTHFEINMPVPPKTIIPREPSAISGFWDTLKTLGPYAFMYGIFTGGGLGNTTTVNNNAAATQ